jgi:hypothetical protein
LGTKGYRIFKINKTEWNADGFSPAGCGDGKISVNHLNLQEEGFRTIGEYIFPFGQSP